MEFEPARVLRINYIHPPLIRRVYAECSPLLQLIKLINDLKNDESETILQQIEMRNNSYRTFSYNVAMVFLVVFFVTEKNNLMSSLAMSVRPSVFCGNIFGTRLHYI